MGKRSQSQLLAKAEYRCCCFAEMTTEASQSVCCHLWNKMTLGCQLFWKAWLFKLDSLLFNEVWWRFCSVSRFCNSSPKAKEINEEQEIFLKRTFLFGLFIVHEGFSWTTIWISFEKAISIIENWFDRKTLISSPQNDGC